MCFCESTLQNTTDFNVNFTMLYVKLIEIALTKFSKTVFSLISRVEKLCFSDSQFAWIVHLYVASLEAKIERICFSGVNIGLSE